MKKLGKAAKDPDDYVRLEEDGNEKSKNCKKNLTVDQRAKFPRKEKDLIKRSCKKFNES